MDMLERIIRKEAAIASVERGFDMKPSEYIAYCCHVTQKTAQRRMQRGDWTWTEILKLIVGLRRMDGSNPFLDAIHSELADW